MYMILPDYVEYEESLECIGPAEGWAQEKEYHPTWVPVVGLPDAHPEQHPVRKVAMKCAQDMPLYVFWDKGNTRSLNAVGVYRWDQRRDCIDSESLLGYLPDNIAAACITDYLAEDKRFVGIIKKIFVSETGDFDVFLELISFANAARRKQLLRDNQPSANPA